MNILEYENYHEAKTHVELTFPYNTYLCSIPLDFSGVPLHWHDDMELIYIQYIAVVLGTSGEAYGYVTLMISDKLRTLLKLIPLPKKMSQTPDQAEEFNVYSYLKQLIWDSSSSRALPAALAMLPLWPGS